jgi:flagellar basal-body rod protein FlgB
MLTGAAMETLFSGVNYTASKRMLDATALRHQAIASNLANLEVGKYRRVDLQSGFRTALKDAVRRNDATGLDALRPSITEDVSAVSRRPDGNTVNLASELLAMQDNALENAVHTQLVNGRLARLRTAIVGRV